MEKEVVFLIGFFSVIGLGIILFSIISRGSIKGGAEMKKMIVALVVMSMWAGFCVAMALYGWGILPPDSELDDGVAATTMAVDVPLDIKTLEEEGYVSGSVIQHGNSDTFERELIERLIDGLKSAEIHIEYDESGHYHGVISLYWER